MNVKTIVKVMNFHAILRVDQSRKQAEKYAMLETEISNMLEQIVNNRNFILDKNIQNPKKSAPVLNIFFGSDFGFCGSINTQINSLLAEHEEGEAITVGKKIRTKREISMHIGREEFENNFEAIEAKLNAAVNELAYSQINIIYNHYHNISTVEPTVKCIYPMDLRERTEDLYTEDYAVEGDICEIARNLILTYLEYEVKIAAINSFASENVARQNATNESLKKIEEYEEERARLYRKIKNRKIFEKMIDNYIKKKGLGGRR